MTYPGGLRPGHPAARQPDDHAEAQARSGADSVARLRRRGRRTLRPRSSSRLGRSCFVIPARRSASSTSATRGSGERTTSGVQLPYLDRLTHRACRRSGQRDRPAAIGADRLHAGLGSRARPRDAASAGAARAVRIEELGVTPDADAFVFNLRPSSGPRTRAARGSRARSFARRFRTRWIAKAFADTVFLGAAVPIHGPVTPGNSSGSGRASRDTSSHATRPRRSCRASG